MVQKNLNVAVLLYCWRCWQSGIIQFDPKTKEISIKTDIEQVGQDPSCVVVYDTIHFFVHGQYKKEELGIHKSLKPYL